MDVSLCINPHTLTKRQRGAKMRSANKNVCIFLKLMIKDNTSERPFLCPYVFADNMEQQRESSHQRALEPI